MSGLAAIVIATTRVPGVDGPLALAPWAGDETLVEYVVAQIRAAGVRDIEVVIPPDGDALIPLVARDNVEPVVDPRGSGLASAIQIGATVVPRGSDAALIIDVAEPRPAGVVRALIDAHGAHGAVITRPSFEDTTGAPFVAGEAALAALRNIADDAALKALLERFADSSHVEPMDDGIVLLAIASNDELVRARRLLGTT